MKSYFPFTDYDFYAYLTSGLVILFCVDATIFHSAYMFRPHWQVVEVALVVGLAYAVGHLLSGISAAIYERRLVRRFLGSPTAVLLGRVKPRLGWLFGAYFESFPEPLTQKIKAVIISELGEPSLDDSEAIFHFAFAEARRSDDLCKRLDEFRSQYGFCRNMALAGLIGSVLFLFAAAHVWAFEFWGAAALLFFLSIGMTFRFLKFYKLYAVDVLRNVAFKSQPKVRAI